MATQRLFAIALLTLAPAAAALADDPPPPPQGVWIGKGQLGFLSSHGNSDAESLNANVDLLRYDGPWKNEIYVGGLRYEHDLFDGFEYQYSLTGGMGYKLVNTEDTKLTVQAGVGYRRLRPEVIVKDDTGEVISRTPLDATGEAIGTVGVDFSHAFTKTTTLTNKFLMESGSSDTLLHDELALNVKMSDKLALSVGYGITDNTKPPAPLKKLDTVATVNLVFAF